MKVPHLGLTMAAAMSLCWPAAAQATLMQVLGSGIWDSVTAESLMTSANSSFSFNFIVDDALVHSPATVSSFRYSLDGQRVAVTAPIVSFYSEAQGGGFEMKFGDTLLTGFGRSLLSAGGQMTIGKNVAMDFSTAGGDAAARGTVTTRSFAAPAVPEPATWLMMLTGIGMLGYACRRGSSLRSVSGASGAASLRA